jgi:hypothetical protein
MLMPAGEFSLAASPTRRDVGRGVYSNFEIEFQVSKSRFKLEVHWQPTEARADLG